MTGHMQSVLLQAGGGGLGLDFILMMGLMFGIIYFLLLRPQRKRETDHQKLIAALKRGDEVVLTSGIFAKVHAVDEKTLVVEIAEKTRVKLLKSAVSGLAPSAARSLEAANDDAVTVPASGAGTDAKPVDKAEKKAKKSS